MFDNNGEITPHLVVRLRLLPHKIGYVQYVQL